MIDLTEYPALFAARNRSGRTLSFVKESLQSIDAHVVTVAASGSLGRLEQLGHSDGDFIVLLNDDVGPGSQEARNAFDSVWEALAPLELGSPKATGIYATPASCRELCEPSARGKIAESVSVFGKRMQLLQDCQPVFGENEFLNVIDAILDWYCPEAAFSERESRFRYLIDDLLRYFRSLSVMYRWEARGRPGYWRLRNVKLRHSRLLNCAGLMLLLGEADCYGDEAISWLKERLSLTPLERVAEVFRENGVSELSEITESYEHYLARLADQKFFTHLTDKQDSRLEDQPEYRELELNAERIVSVLSHFLILRKSKWNACFYHGMFF